MFSFNPSKNSLCPCCIHRNLFGRPYSCQLCRNAWILSQVSPYIRDCVMAHGRSQSLLWTRWYNERRREQEMPRWGYKPQWSQSSWIDPDGWSSHFSRDWAASYWDDDWAASSWDDDWWSGTRWRSSPTFGAPRRQFRSFPPHPLHLSPLQPLPPHRQPPVAGPALHQMD